MNTEDIREVLLKFWDPLGVGENKNLRNEYDEYINEIKSVLLKGADEEDVTNILMRYDKMLGAEHPDYGFSNPAARLLLLLRA